MKDLIEALQIFLKYKNLKYPIQCMHDELLIADILIDEVSEEDIEKLDTLGFFWSEEGCFKSFKFGSC
jgi:hypothetical protein